MEKFKSQKFCSVLYPDCEEHVKALEIIKASYDCAYILHDRDVYEDEDLKGQLKKAHWHVVFRVGKCQRWNTSVSKPISLETLVFQR